MKVLLNPQSISDFDNLTHNIISGSTFSLGGEGKCDYIAHAATIFDVEQAVSLIDFINKKYNSEECLPFAISLVEFDQKVEIAEDNGEIGCGRILLESLRSYMDGYNIMVCITRKIHGVFVIDMFQDQKHHVVKNAAISALHKLSNILKEKSI